MRGLDADEYAALLQALVGCGTGEASIVYRLLARGLLTAPEVIPGAPHAVVRLNATGRLAILCHELASRTYD